MTTAVSPRPSADEVARARDLAAELGRIPTSNEIRAALGVGRDVANRVRAELDQSVTGHHRATVAGHPADGAGHPPLTVVADVDTRPVEDSAGHLGTVAGHPADDERATPGHLSDTAAHLVPEGTGAAANVDMTEGTGHPLPLVTDGGPRVDGRTGRLGPEVRATTGHLPVDVEPTPVTDGDQDHERATNGPVVDLAGRQRATPAVDGPVDGPMAAADTTPSVDHSTEQATYGPVANDTSHPGPGQRATPTGYTRRVRKLAAQAAEARQLRALHVQPDIRAVLLMRQRRNWTLFASLALFGALASTAVNVQRFASGDAPMWTVPWLAGWLVDPAFSVLLVGILVARGNLSAVRHKVTDAMVLLVEYGLLAAVLVMNVTPELEAVRVDAGQVMLHALLPLLGFGAASVITRIQDRFAAAIDDLYAGGDR